MHESEFSEATSLRRRAMTKMTQGPWTRIRPLQIDEVDDKTAVAMKAGELTWGHFPNNLIKVIAYCPRLAHTEVEYANSFTFDPVTLMGDLQIAGFNDRFLKELEPISKSFEEDNEAGKLDKAKEIVCVVLPTNEDPALPLNPGEEALDEPASHVAAKPSPILRGRLASVAPMRRD